MSGHELTDRGAGTRALILDTALAAFAESGYRGTSVRDIATRCGLTHPALLYHFPTKADLLMAVLRRRDDAEGRAAGFADLRGAALLDHLVATARLNAGRPGVVELYATLSAEATDPGHPAHAYFVDRYANLRASVARAYAEVAHDGGLRPGIDPATAARQLVALMDGLQIQWLLDPSLDMAEAIEAHVGAQLA
ncbi:TetR/AcrR family transcriptional regulator [Demequina sp. SYSU T00192]|uniref:TetR/AcrR family transcriptional regulator n=1 Tax=Demequina litoralis TaxID=3051660 RepID=A0ABT8GC49_9MICO|nr:TetR/AcrR family transcriptional regulator [Demequina sp. SYSU T00192]MDN4476559.1 TetR/AcrR family transcriptional regulator [Demequina sp. SYSU T00192]